MSLRFLCSYVLLTTKRRAVIIHLEHQEEQNPVDKSSDIVQGTLDMLVLKTLALQPMHGYGITVRLEQMSQGTFRINAARSL